ncbi:hypothetical protein AVEN_201945-1 [Araneus ventricosus]|uniref:Uncharacterized protein n=1 Tax=Araneus ventricosus TaxID=182803 RepID=A0A4Y2KTX4_ARAVE|nr:hypothetical protein AVEN_52987-1 [Araneus ventricosus]GBN05619.1 hypothetical protein AVEN_201945-1 [Araneus ventricosus]
MDSKTQVKKTSVTGGAGCKQPGKKKAKERKNSLLNVFIYSAGASFLLRQKIIALPPPFLTNSPPNCEAKCNSILSSVVSSWLCSSTSSSITWLSSSSPKILAKDTISLTADSTDAVSNSSNSHSAMLFVHSISHFDSLSHFRLS